MPHLLLDPVFISSEETARLLGISRSHVYELLNQRLIASRYIGRRRMVLKASLDDFIDGLSDQPH